MHYLSWLIWLKSIPAHPHSSLNTCARTVFISPADCTVYDKDWSDCENNLLACLFVYDSVSIQCYTIPPQRLLKLLQDVAKITLWDDLPMKLMLVWPYGLLSRQCQKCWCFDHPAKHWPSSLRGCYVLERIIGFFNVIYTYTENYTTKFRIIWIINNEVLRKKTRFWKIKINYVS